MLKWLIVFSALLASTWFLQANMLQQSVQADELTPPGQEEQVDGNDAYNSDDETLNELPGD
jgi:hypothetical protein